MERGREKGREGKRAREGGREGERKKGEDTVESMKAIIMNL